jgi:HD superfamily phosphodiesterase
VAFGTLNVNEASLAIAAALLHDAGKIQTMNPSGMNPQVAQLYLSLLDYTQTRLTQRYSNTG